MLRLTVSTEEYLMIGDNVKIVFLGGTKNHLRIMVDAPKDVNIVRSAVLENRVTDPEEKAKLPKYYAEPETDPKYLKKKIYHVHLDKNLTKADMEQIAAGIQLDDGEIQADAISYTDDFKKDEVGIEIHSGKNRIVRRIFESLGYKVVKLDRVFFAGLTKKGLRRGEWRYLTEQEVNFLRMGSFE